MLVNSNTFQIKSTITDDWGSRHRVVLDLEALSSAEDWKFEISLLDNYQIDQIYGAELTEEGGKSYISGSGRNESLNQGDNLEIVLIIDEGNSSNKDPTKPEFIFADSNHETTINSNTFNIKSTITDDWGGKHRLVLDVEALSSVEDWKFEISLPNDYQINEIYSGEITQSGGKTYISGASWNESLRPGEKAEIVLIIDEGNSSDQEPILPQFIFTDSNHETTINSNTFNIKSTITDDWGGKHRLVLDVEALSSVEDWKFEISLPNDYQINEIYSGEITQSGGKTYISGANWNKSLSLGEKAEIVLIIDEGNSSSQEPILPQFIFADSIDSNSIIDELLINSNTFNIKSTITDDWGGKHRLVLDVEALSSVEDWKFEISLADDYQIDQIYRAELIQEGGKKYISGIGWNESLSQGDNLEIILIVDEGNSRDDPPIAAQFIFADSTNLKTNNSTIQNTLVNSDTFNVKSTITDDWGGSHRVVLDVEALSSVEDWKFEISLADDYQIDQIYSAELTQEGDKTYISGVGWNESLSPGDNVEIVLIIDEGNSSYKEPIASQIIFSDSIDSNSNTDLNVESAITDDWGGSHRVVLDLEAESSIRNWKLEASLHDDYNITQIYSGEITQENGKNYISGVNWNESLNQGDNTEIVLIIDEGNSSYKDPITSQFTFTNSIYNPKTINVDTDFGGNLESAIAAAQDGDTVQLSSRTYYTDGINLDKDITLLGQAGSVINGTSTLEPIINLSSGASGTTIKNLEITNGDIGIYGYSAFDLTLQNLNINNIGLNKTVRDGQNNTGIVLNRANGLKLLDSSIKDVSRKGVGVNDTDGALISGLTVQNINLGAQHSQSFDAAGIKFFNTNKVTVKNSYFSDSNAMSIWNDTTNATTIEGNTVVNVGEDFLKPDFDYNTNISGIYNEKSSNAIIINNEANALDGFLAFNATEFSTPTMTLMGNNFSSMAVNTQDYWVNEPVEKLIAVTEDPDEANFSLFEDEYFAQAIIG